MDYSSNSRSISSGNHLSIDSSQNFIENNLNNHSNDGGNLSPAQFNIYDEKQNQNLTQTPHFQYQNQPPSLNQLLQNNQYSPYGAPSLRPQNSVNYHSNYWNLSQRSQNDATRMYYSQYQDSYGQQGNDGSYSKIDKIKNAGEIESNYINDARSYQNEEVDKTRAMAPEWKINNIKSERSSPKDVQSKQELDKKVDKSNSIDMSDNTSMKSDSHLTTDYNSNTSSAESLEKNDLMYHNANYPLDNKISQTQMKHPNQMCYDNANYGQMMMHPNANYYSHLRYPNPQNNTHNYVNPNNSPMMPNAMNRPPVVNYPPYMQTSSPIPGYGYPQMGMHQVRTPYNVHTPYAPRSSQSPFSGNQEAYMNGSNPPLYSGGMKESADRKEETMAPAIVKQETSDSGSTSNKSATARSSKSKNAIKSESHPTTPVSNTIPSPSQTSMSSVIDENDDSVSSLGPNDSNIIHHPVTQFNQHQISPNMSQNPSMMYPQPYPHNQIQHPIIGSYPGNVGPQPRPFPPSPNMMPGRQYHHQNDSQVNNSCFQKLLELGSEPERGPWVERYLKFMQENNTPLGAVPTVVKQPLDLFRLYHAVRERGGLLNVVKTKRWKEICHIVNVNASASGAYTLRRNYIKCLLDYECRFDRNGVDPAPILQEIQSLSDKKKKSTSRTTGSSSSSTISSGQPPHHNSEFAGNPSTPRPSLPPPDFNSPHSFPGHNPYNNPLHNGSLMHRSPMHYPAAQRSPYPGPYNGPRIMGGFNPPTSPMHQPIRYDSNIPPNWNKPLPMSQQQWPSPSSSTNSSSTHPMQMSMSPGTPSNSISSSSQQSQPPGDSFDVGTKDPPKLDSTMARYTMSDSVIKASDTFTEKDADKIEPCSKSDTNFYNQPYSGLSGQEGSFDYYHHNKALSSNVNPLYPPMQYPGFPFSRQYGSTFRQSTHNPLSFPSYYPPNPSYIYPPGTISHSSNLTSNSLHTTSSTSSHSPYYPIGSLQEHTRRMEWKSNYGGMPPPPPPPPNGQASVRGSVPPNITNPSQLGPGGSHSQYHSSMPHCNYTNQNHASFNQQRPLNPQLPSNMMPQNRHMLPTSTSNMPEAMNYLNKSVSSNSVPPSPSHMSSTTCHSRSQIDNARLTQSYSSQYTYSKSSSNMLKRYDHLFPPNCVEATLPDYSKKRKYSSKDIKTFNPATVTMALKSGLVAEVSWALNHLNIWSRDDNFDKLTLKNIMPLFQALIDVWRNSLGILFGYDLFIKDLELPVNLERQHLTKSDLRNVLCKVECDVKTECSSQTKDEEIEEHCDKREDKIKVVKEKVVEMLNCGKYQSDKNNLTVKLDLSCKLESVIGGRVELVDFIRTVLGDLEGPLEVVSREKSPSLSQLWEVGGSDCTFHIMPPILSQQSSIHVDWYNQLMGYIDCGHSVQHCGPPEIKRSRCISPPTSLRTSSPNPPVLLHESSVTDDVARVLNKSEVYNDGESLFFEIKEVDEEKILRSLCVSIVIRNLSFVSGNDRIMGTNRSLLVILGRLLLLGHRHNEKDDDGKEEWWSKWIDDIREHVLVTLVNISSYLELESYAESIVQPIIHGLLHWLTCQSAEAEDALPSHRVLGCRRLSLECVMRLCVHDRNIDFIVSASNNNGDLIVRQLFDYLASSFCYPEVQVVKEMSLAVMHYLSLGGTDNGLGCMYLAHAKPCVISGLISFIEITESQIRHVVENMGMEALQARPELMGTSLEFLRHSGALLNKIASHDVNRTQFTRDHEIRMLNLVISTVLDQTVAQSISGVLFLLSSLNLRQDPPSQDLRDSLPGNKFRSFLTFDDLSFCDKDNCSTIPRKSSPQSSPASTDDLPPTTVTNGPS